MTPAEYSIKYNIPRSTVYKWLVAGKICGERTPFGWNAYDAPPKLPEYAPILSSISDYAAALIWFNAAIRDDAVTIRNKNAYITRRISQEIKSSQWQRENGTYICKISSVNLVRELRAAGFTGRKDSEKTPPPVEPQILVQALSESHSYAGYQLHYNRRFRGDKSHASYMPCFSVFGSEAIINAYADALYALNIAPRRKPSCRSTSNGTTYAVKYTSPVQLRAIADLVGTDCDADFWDKYSAHISAEPIPYEKYHQNQNFI